MAPRTVGRYRLQRVLGVGMFSKVMLCVDERTGEHYAMKIMRKETLEDMDMARYARREAFVLRRLSHPGVISLIEAVQSESKLFLVMPVAPGHELLSLVTEGPLTEENARIYICQLVDAVAYLHKRGIAHRDLKPENVIADKHTDSLKLIDFGLTGVIRKDELMRTVCGSSFYSAPEVTYNAGDGYDGAKADVWSIGILSYILLTAVHPFVDEDGELLVSALREGTLEFPSHLSRGAVHFLSRLLAVNPLQRYSMVQASLHPWLTGRPLQSPLSPSSSSRPSAANSSSSTRPRVHDYHHQHSPALREDADSGSTLAIGNDMGDDPDSATEWHRNSITSAFSSNASIFSSPSHVTGRPAKRPGTFSGPFHASPFFGRSTADRTNHSAASLAVRRPATAENSAVHVYHPSSSPFSRLRRLAGGGSARHQGEAHGNHAPDRVDSNLGTSDLVAVDPIEHDAARCDEHHDDLRDMGSASLFTRFSVDSSKHHGKDASPRAKKMEHRRIRTRGLLSRRAE